MNKLERIKKIIKEASKGEDKIHCIEEILEEIDD